MPSPLILAEYGLVTMLCAPWAEFARDSAYILQVRRGLEDYTVQVPLRAFLQD
jgi:hypothetical protein